MSKYIISPYLIHWASVNVSISIFKLKTENFLLVICKTLIKVILTIETQISMALYTN